MADLLQFSKVLLAKVMADLWNFCEENVLKSINTTFLKTLPFYSFFGRAKIFYLHNDSVVSHYISKVVGSFYWRLLLNYFLFPYLNDNIIDIRQSDQNMYVRAESFFWESAMTWKRFYCVQSFIIFSYYLL